MSRNWHYCVGSEDEVLVVVRNRFARPLFVEATVDDATHTVEIADDVVCEYGMGLASSLLPARLAAATREPVDSMIRGELWHAIQTEPNGTVLSGAYRAKPFPWRPTTILHYAEDPDKRLALAHRYFKGLPEVVSNWFPLRARLARLDCKKIVVGGGTLNGFVRCDLQLAVYRAVGDDKELVDLRTDTVELCNTRWQHGIVLDEQIVAFEKSMRRLMRELEHKLEETTDWTGITPTKFLGVE